MDTQSHLFTRHFFKKVNSKKEKFEFVIELGKNGISLLAKKIEIQLSFKKLKDNAAIIDKNNVCIPVPCMPWMNLNSTVMKLPLIVEYEKGS